MKMKYFGITKTNLFLFHWIFKNRGGVGMFKPTLEPNMDPPLNTSLRVEQILCTLWHTIVHYSDKNESHVAWTFRHLTSVVCMLSSTNKD